MSNPNFENAISVLQQFPDSKGALNALISIRKEVEWPKNRANVARLRERGCLKQITGILLGSVHKSCINLALSILGNCLMDRACTSEVVAQHSIMSLLNQLLKKYPKEDSINGRTFRIVGNMCQHRDQWATIMIDKKPFIISHTVEVIKRSSKDGTSEEEEDEKISEATVITALRALRELLNCHTVMTLVKQFGALRAIGSLFIKYSKEWQENKRNEKMLLDIVRVIHEYSRFRYYHSILEMRNTDRGDSLIHLSSVLILSPRRIVKIVMNFIRSCQLQSELPIREICFKFVEVLEDHSIVKEFDGNCIEYLQCLCYLLDHPANRNEERCGTAIPLLIKVLKEFEQPSNNVVECCTLLIHTLNKFKYCDKLMLDQLKHGIIQVLIDKLSWIVGQPNALNLKHASEKKRKYIFGPSSPVLSKRKLLHDDTLKECGSSPNSSDDEFDVFNRYRTTTRSPSLCSSSDCESVNALSWAEPNSPGSPSQSLVNDSLSDSDNYSPVCSEADDTDFPLCYDQLGDQGFPDPLLPPPDLDDSFENYMEEGSTSDDDKKNILLSLKMGLTQAIVRLIKSFIKLRPPPPHLANVDLLMQLTKCSITEQFDVKDVICDIIKYHENLIPLMQTDFIQTLHDMRTLPPNHDCCSKCSVHMHFTYSVLRRFTETAESGVGKGDIAHKLLRGDTETKQKLVMVIPYIIGNRSILGKLMLNCGGLEILMKLLRENDEQDNKRSLKVLCQMASNCLLISNPRKTQTDLNRPKLVADKYKLPENCSNVVSFLFDDGNVVRADRDFLSKKSEFFNGLLNGHFRESGQSEITLSNVESKSFRSMLYLMMKIDKTETIEIDLDLDTLLDVILLCDRYLLVDLCVWLTDSVEQFRISTDAVPTIYNWSVGTGTNLLRVESVAFALVAKVDEKERYTMFENLFNLGYKEQLVEDIQNLLMRYLTLSDYNQRVRDLSTKRKHLKEKMRDSLLKDNV